NNPPPAPEFYDWARQHVPGYLAYLILSNLASTLAAAALVVAALGLFRLRPWARTLALAYAAYAVVAGAAEVLYGLLFIFPATPRFLDELRRWQLTHRPPGPNMVYEVNDFWPNWVIPITLGLAVLALGFAALIAGVLLPRSTAVLFVSGPSERPA